MLAEDGQNISIRLFKDRALFAYLEFNAIKSFSCGALAGLLWSEQPEDKARHSLSQSLSSICNALGTNASIVVRGRKEISLQEGTVEIDVDRFLNFASVEVSKIVIELSSY